MGTTTTGTLRERLDPARDQVGAAAAGVRDRAADIADEVRDRAGSIADEVAGARDRVTGVAEGLVDAVEPTAERVSGSVTDAVKAAATALVGLPAALTGLGQTIESVVDRAAETGREAVHRVDPPRSAKRRSALRSLAWFVGGFLAGLAAGWFASSRANPEPEWLAPSQEAPADAQEPAPALPLRPDEGQRAATIEGTDLADDAARASDDADEDTGAPV